MELNRFILTFSLLVLTSLEATLASIQPSEAQRPFVDSAREYSLAPNGQVLPTSKIPSEPPKSSQKTTPTKPTAPAKSPTGPTGAIPPGATGPSSTLTGPTGITTPGAKGVQPSEAQKPFVDSAKKVITAPNGSVLPPNVLPANVKVEVHGFVKLDTLHDNRIPFGDPIFATLPTIPLNSNRARHHSQTIIDARDSRLWVDSNADYCNIKWYSRIEGDFNTAGGDALVANSRFFRIRHAFLRAEWRNWFFLFGQTWSILTVPDIAWVFMPQLSDYHGPASFILPRQPQLRMGYKYPLCDKWGFLRISVGVEKQSVFHFIGEDDAVGSEQGLGQNMPLFGAKAEWKEWQPLQLDGTIVATQDRLLRASGETNHADAWGYRIVAQSRICWLTIYGSYLNLTGLNRVTPLAFVDVVSRLDGHLVATRAHGGYVGIILPLTKDENTNLVGLTGYLKAKEIPGTAFSGDVIEKYYTWQVCLSHRFLQNYAFATDIKRFHIKSFNGRRGDMYQLSATFWYYF